MKGKNQPIIRINVLSLVLLLVGITQLDAQKLTFFVIGDWGGTSAWPWVTDVQRSVALAMGYQASLMKPDYILTVGDNFYDTGVTSASDPRWQYTFEEVYTQPELQVPWYIVAGNRDHYGNVTAQLEYTKLSHRWYFPALNYDKIFPIPNTNATVHLIAINSWDITSSSRKEEAVGAPPFDQLKQFEVISYVSKTLSTSNATWKILLTHYPIWSAGAHGPNDLDLIQVLEPILLRWPPDIYLAGHDHCLQHILVNNINYYIVGSGAEVAKSWVGKELGLPPSAMPFTFPDPFVEVGGFASVVITANDLQVTFYDTSNSVLYSNTHYPRNLTNPNSPVPPPNFTSNTTSPVPKQTPFNGTLPHLVTALESSIPLLYSAVLGTLATVVIIVIIVGAIFFWRLRTIETA